jgi:hypothetical protein
MVTALDPMRLDFILTNFRFEASTGYCIDDVEGLAHCPFLTIEQTIFEFLSLEMPSN